MTPTTEPLRHPAGDTLAFTKTLADYPADDAWVLSYTLINGTHKITFAATASGANSTLGGFMQGDVARVDPAIAKHLVEEAKVAVYVDAADKPAKKKAK